MSLIEQALRRIKDPVATQDATAPVRPAAAPPTAGAPTPAPTAHSWQVTPQHPAGPEQPASPSASDTRLTAVILGLVLALTFLLLIGGGRWIARTLPSRRLAVPDATAAPARAPASRQLQAPAPVEPQLVLTGVVAGGGEPYAVINGVIASVGETVDGWTLVAVTEQSATLRSRDEERTLRVPRP